MVREGFRGRRQKSVASVLPVWMRLKRMSNIEGPVRDGENLFKMSVVEVKMSYIKPAPRRRVLLSTQEIGMAHLAEVRCRTSIESRPRANVEAQPLGRTWHQACRKVLRGRKERERK